MTEICNVFIDGNILMCDTESVDIGGDCIPLKGIKAKIIEEIYLFIKDFTINDVYYAAIIGQNIKSVKEVMDRADLDYTGPVNYCSIFDIVDEDVDDNEDFKELVESYDFQRLFLIKHPTSVNIMKNVKIHPKIAIEFKDLLRINKYGLYTKILENKEEIRLENVLQKILNGNENVEYVDKFIDIDHTDKFYSDDVFIYSTGTIYRSDIEVKKDSLILMIDRENIDTVLDIEKGTFEYIDIWSSQYRNYEWYFDKEEYNYIHTYIESAETFKIIENLADKVDYEIKVEEEGEIYEFFKYLGLEDLLSDIKGEVMSVKESSISDHAGDILKKLCFEYENKYYNKKGVYLLKFNYNNVINYIKDNKLNVHSFKELLENTSDVAGMSMDFEYSSYDYEDSYNAVDRAIQNIVEECIDDDNELMKYIIIGDNLELFKKYYKEFDSGSYIRDRNTFHYMFTDSIIKKDTEIYNFVSSFEFQDFMISKDKDMLKMYDLLSFCMNPETEKKYRYLKRGNKYDFYGLTNKLKNNI